MYTKLISLFVSTLIFTAGCGKDEGSADESSLTNMAALSGTWTGACKAVGDAYGMTTYTFTDTTYYFQSAAYSDAACTTVDNYISMRGTYGLPGDMTTTAGVALAMIDYTNVQATWTFVSRPSLADDWSALCGNATVSNNTLDVLGKACDTGTYKLSFAAATFGTIYVGVDGRIHPTDVHLSGATLENRSVGYDGTYGGLTKVVAAP